MDTYILDLLEYNQAINQRLAEIYSTKDMMTERAHSLFGHILNAHAIWNSRIKGALDPVKPWDMLNTVNYSEMNKALHADTLMICEENNLNRVVDYMTSTGIPMKSKVADIIFHIINHSTYHRGQIATEMKLAGIEPLATDYIFYKRESI